MTLSPQRDRMPRDVWDTQNIHEAPEPLLSGV